MRRPSAAIALLALLASLSASPPSHALSTPSFTAPPLFNLGPKKPAPSLVFTYQGFQVDASAAPRGQAPDKTVRLIKAQIDLVLQVGLKPDVLTFMRGVPILSDPAKPGAPGESGRYVAGRGVMIRITRLGPKKPILLAGMLQAYHAQRLAGGVKGADITRYRTEVMDRRIPVWPNDALMLKTDTDFFALTSAAYLYGEITREPYTRTKLRQTQPDYYRWLAALFDDGRARG